MEPIEISAILTLLQAAINQIPALATDIKTLFAGDVPTDASWAALQASIAAETYGSFVSQSALPPSETNT